MIQRKRMNPIAIICINVVALGLLYFLISLFFGGKADWWNAIVWDEPMSGSGLVAFFLMVAAFMCVVYILYGLIQLLRFGPKGESVTNSVSSTVGMLQPAPPTLTRRRRVGAASVIVLLFLGVATMIAVPTLTTIGAIYSQLKNESVEARIDAVDKLAE